MAKHIARYAVTYGLSGCYMPDSEPMLITAATRTELADIIRAELAFYDMPANRFADVSIRTLWALIKRHGSSSAHFRLTHNGYTLRFSGLTEDEANAFDVD